MTSATDFFTTMIFPMAFVLVVAAEDRRLRLWRKLTFLYLGPLSFSCDLASQESAVSSQ